MWQIKAVMNINDILKQYFGYDNFRPNQKEIIETVMTGKDTLVLMPTGGGKSMCYQVPAIALPGTTIVISPLISLMKDQVESLKSFGVSAEALNSNNDSQQDIIIRRKCYSGEIKLLYVSPEKFMAEIDYFFKNINISLFAIDEAHCISQWGHDFRQEYTQLSAIHKQFPDVPIMALTATADKITRNDIITQLELKSPVEFISSFDRPNISLCVKRGYTSKEKLNFITQYIKARPFEPGIIYCLSRKNTESVANNLRKYGINADVYHAGLSSEQRNIAQEMFKQDKTQVVCATIAFGMGIDKSNVRWIIHYNLPKSIESFYQEIGRAGRDGAPAETFLFYSLSDVIQMSQFIKESGQKEANKTKLMRMQEYAESSVCRRRILLNYFNEETEHNCNNCDICNNPPQRFDGTKHIQMVLSAVKRTGETISSATAIEILKGMRSPNVVKKGYDQLPTFGVGKDISLQDWQDYILQMLQMGYADLAYDQKNALKITALGNEVLYGKKTAELTKPIKIKTEKPAKKKKLQLEIPVMRIPGLAVPTNNEEDPKLFDALRALRKSIAEKENILPYIVFNDKVLHLLATIKPTDIETFGSISGIGEFKKNKYGKIFIDIIKQFV